MNRPRVLLADDHRRLTGGPKSLLASPERWWVASIGLAVAVGIAYFLAARLSLYLLTKPDGVAVFWPAAGVSSGVLIALGRDARWPVAVGTMVATIVANLTGDRNVWSAFAFALCNAGEALLTAWLIERYFGSNFSLDRLRHVLGLVAAAIVGASASGVVATVAYKLLHSPAAPALITWQHWFASDALGIITVAPLVIGLASALRKPPPRSELIEGTVALAAVAAMTGMIISTPSEPWGTLVPVALLFPLLLWLSARCRPVFASAAAFIVSLTIVWAITFGVGHFGNPGLAMDDRILGAQSSILGVAICAFVLAALFAERRQHEAVLEESEARLQEALAAGAVTAFEWDVRTDLSRHSENVAQVLGFDPQQTVSGSSFLTRVHPDDRARFKALVRGVRPDGPSYAVTFRFIRPDGREMWLEETGRAEFDAEGRFVRLKGLTRDITERKWAEERQAARELSGRLINAQEEERSRLARELHDDVTQRLAVLAINAGREERDLPSAAGGNAMRAMREGLIRLSEDVHALSYRLHPTILEDLGLIEALKTECEGFGRMASIRVDVKAQEIPEPLPYAVALCLYRITQEALRNVRRHAGASAVQVSLRPLDGGVQLAVRDNGAGFDPAQQRDRPSLGHASMRQRIYQLDGELDVDSAPGHGTTVVAWVPLKEEQREPSARAAG